MLRRAGVAWADSFTRANQSGLGNGWILGNGSTQPAISSNTAVCTTTGSNAYYPALFGAQVHTDRYYVQVQLASAPTATAGGLIIRGNTGFTQQVAALVSTSGTGIYLITTPTASSATGEASNSSTPYSSGSYMTVSVSGNVYTLWQSTTPTWQTGTNVLSWTDSSSVTSNGLGYRYGGIVVQTTPISFSMKNFVMADY